MWPEGNYRRIFLDMHIADWNPEFLSQVDPQKIVPLLRDAGAQQIVVKCRPHTGLAHFPTKFGRMHRGLKGRDYVGEMIDLCHKNGIAVMAYLSQVNDNIAYEQHPTWRIVNGKGATSCEPENGRYGQVCPNNLEYRAYLKDCLTEMAENYEFESIFLDMPFWPCVCYCSTCREKYFQATGKDIPRIVRWDDPAFREWQKLREAWITEFTAFTTGCVKAVRPETTVEHNMSLMLAPWQCGLAEETAENCDYVGGDLYGGFLEQTFACKYYRNLSKILPFVYITSRCDPGLTYHTTTKSEDEFLLHAITALVHNGAFSICDGMNPDGTICEDVYTGVVKRVFETTAPYEKYVSGNMISNVAVWFSSHAKYDREENGRPIIEADGMLWGSPYDAYLQTPLKMCQILREENIPFDVLPSKSLKSYKGNLLIIPNVANIQDDEMRWIEDFVLNGGNLYVSGAIGHPRLLELLDAEQVGFTQHNVTYMSPTESGKRFFTDFTPKNPLSVQSGQQLVKFHGEYELLATLTLPYTLPGTRQFASIHSNPPGSATNLPSAIVKNVGQGKVLWVAAPIETSRPYMSRRAVGRMIRWLSGKLPFEAKAPAFVEVLGWDKDGKRYFAAINQQEVAPIAPMSGVKIILPYKISKASIVETNEPLSVQWDGEQSIIELPEIHIFQMITVV